MRKKRGIILAVVLAAGLGGLVWLLFPKGEPEPVYQGKPLSAWLEPYTDPTGADPRKARRDADDAVRHIGTNALPTLLRMLGARDSALKLKLLALVQKQHFIESHYVRASARNQQALRAFDALRADAKDVVPALMTIYDENISPESRLTALESLGRIGPAAEAAVPLLVRVVADTNTPDPNARLVRLSAILTLEQIHARPELIVPALIKVLNDPQRGVPEMATRALGEFGPEAKAAVPALFKLLADPDPDAVVNAAATIKKIDPEAAAQRKAEIDAAISPMKPR